MEPDIPSNVCRVDQLDLLPDECLSGDPDRPLQHFDENGKVARYSLTPVTYAAIFVLLVEVMERLSFYGLNYTQASYLTVRTNHAGQQQLQLMAGE
jgi:proton-dependent oligopeptide transporter, POT family